jgi:hypothetical protein
VSSVDIRKYGIYWDLHEELESRQVHVDENIAHFLDAVAEETSDALGAMEQSIKPPTD